MKYKATIEVEGEIKTHILDNIIHADAFERSGFDIEEMPEDNEEPKRGRPPKND